MRQYLLAIPFILLFVVFHVSSASLGGEFSNLSPFVALFFCGAAFLQKSKILLPVAVIAWVVSMPIASLVQGYSPWNLGSLVALLSLFAVAGFGVLFKKQKPLALLGGAFSSCVFFHLVTNLVSFVTSPLYTKDWVGLSQALWTTPSGMAQPTSMFFRNMCVGTLLFTGLFIVATHLPYFRKPKVSLATQTALS